MEEKQGLFARIRNRFSNKPAPNTLLEKPKPAVPKHLSTQLEDIPDIKDVALLLLLCDDKDGYKRELAVSQLGSMGNPLVLNKLIERANDWVPQVRLAAKKSIFQLAIRENADAFVKSLPALYHLKKCTREDHSKLIQEIENFLVSDKNSIHVLEGMKSSDAKISKACFALVMEHKLLDPEHFIMRGLKHSELRYRIKSSHRLKDLTGDIREKAIEIAIKDKHMLVRREAFLTMLRAWGSEPLAKQMLFDPHPSIREIAIIHLGKSGADVQYTYLRSLSEDDPKLVSRAIWGLGHLNGIECMQLIEPFLESSFPEIRQQAKKTLEGLSKAPKKFTDTVDWNSIDTLY